MTWDVILGVHLNPLTCGVARFNEQLAKRLGVRVAGLNQPEFMRAKMPLVSIHPREVGSWSWLDVPKSFDLFLHSEPTTERAWKAVLQAQHVYLADPAMNLTGYEVTKLWAPSLLEAPLEPAAINVFTYGMSHKLTRRGFLQLRDLLSGTGHPYTVRVSTAIHEGSPWEKVWSENQLELRRIFGEAFRPLGFLADELVQWELRQADAVALIYDPAARANNTTLWAALEAGATVITTLDHQSPSELVHGQTCYDIGQLTRWPLALPQTIVPRAAAGRSWDKLVEQLTGVPV